MRRSSGWRTARASQPRAAAGAPSPAARARVPARRPVRRGRARRWHARASVVAPEDLARPRQLLLRALEVTGGARVVRVDAQRAAPVVGRLVQPAGGERL